MIKIVLWLVVILPFFLLNCSKDSTAPTQSALPPAPLPTTAAITVLVKSAVDSTPVADANVILVDADANIPVYRLATGTGGQCSVTADTGGYYAKITAQGFKPLSPENSTPLPFSAAAGDSLVKTYYLDTLATTAGLGSFLGLVRENYFGGTFKPVNGVLVIAEDTVTDGRFTAVTGPDGIFALFNLPDGAYRLSTFRAGYQAVDTPVIRVTASVPAAFDTLTMNHSTIARLSGSVTFAAGKNYDHVDITLLDSATFTGIPGLSTVADATKHYLISGIPQGRFLVYASFRNDGHVMDPDWIYQHGVSRIIVMETTGDLFVNFTVTDAISIVAPTNPPDSIYPVITDSRTPRFIWHKYPTAEEYVLEVTDLTGKAIWGGYDRSTGTIRHRQIMKSDTSALFNFDTSATTLLEAGHTYRWKVYADGDSSLGIQHLESASEDLMGLFTVK